MANCPICGGRINRKKTCTECGMVVTGDRVSNSDINFEQAPTSYEPTSTYENSQKSYRTERKMAKEFDESKQKKSTGKLIRRYFFIIVIGSKILSSLLSGVFDDDTSYEESTSDVIEEIDFKTNEVITDDSSTDESNVEIVDESVMEFTQIEDFDYIVFDNLEDLSELHIDRNVFIGELAENYLGFITFYYNGAGYTLPYNDFTEPYNHYIKYLDTYETEYEDYIIIQTEDAEYMINFENEEYYSYELGTFDYPLWATFQLDIYYSEEEDLFIYVDYYDYYYEDDSFTIDTIVSYSWGY